MKKIKGIGLIVLLLNCSLSTRAQELGEWFNQKQTQTKYLAEQIAALQVYLGYLEKGYHITKESLNLIGDIKNGEYNLHKNYFGKLEAVNPNIRKYPKIAAVFSMRTGIHNQYTSVAALLKANDQFSNDERTYIKRVYENLEYEAEGNLNELQMIITGGEMQMTDDERIEQIDQIYRQVLDIYSFSGKFSDKVKTLINQRAQRLKGLKELKKLNGIPFQ